MTTVSKQFFLTDRNPSNWDITTVIVTDEEDNETEEVRAVNRVTGTVFADTMEEFNAYLSMVPGNDYNIEELYELESGVLTPPVLNNN